MTSYLLERAWVSTGSTPEVRDDVLVEVEDGRFTRVEPDRPDDVATRLPGLTLPGFANTHSHVFHRALRGRTQRGSGTFWTWREQMYDLANRLDPDSYHALARATYAEMVAAGYTAVAEFHYLHHQPDGTPYDDRGAMAQALAAAAEDVGIRFTLLPTLYLTGGIGEPLSRLQRRFSLGSAEDFLDAVGELSLGEGQTRGAALHSVRAVPPPEIEAVATWCAEQGAPLHAHVSEQPAENEACVAAYGTTPTGLLATYGALGPMTTAVHATHLTDDDVDLLAGSGAAVSLCPTTERDLGDGIGPARRLADAGVRLSLGSDSQAVVDPFEEMRAVELDERLASRKRGRFTAAGLVAAAARHDTIGFGDAGAIAVGHRADLVTIDTSSARTAGTGDDEHTAVFAATAADVRQVVVDGRIVFAGEHADVGHDLDAVIRKVWS